MNYRHPILAATIALVLGAGSVADAKKFDSQWPKVIKKNKGKVVVYQPQIETFDDILLTGRSAVSVTLEKQSPVFGAIWYEAKVDVDREDRVVKLKEVKVTNAKFPDAKPESVAELKRVIEEEIPNWGDELSYDELVAGLAAVEQEKITSEQLDNAPPEIIYKTKPSILISIDGKPIVQDVPNTKIRRVINTPFFVVEHSSGWYLKGSESWYSAKEALGPYQPMRDLPPRSVIDLADQMVSKPPADEKKPDKVVIPEIVVRTAPAELIQTDGEPNYEPVAGTNLLRVKNSDTTILMDIGTQLNFILIAGRWYASPSLEGPWKYVKGEDLPADFARIPSGSDLGDEVLASVPGTQEAKEAMLENQIPTTAEVDRKTATVTVTYDGDPKFEAIEGTKMSYAVNTDKAVLWIDNRYYCCDQAVWFESNSASGPWVVSAAIPADVKSLPPDCPIYNVKYVSIYESTPEVVYVGYTPAYTGSYVYGGCVVYGTGYYYQPWYGHYYYPRPVTYGFAVHYSPYGGWGMSFGMSYGWFSMSYHSGGGYWGAGGYHAGYHHGYNNGYRRGYGAGYVAGSQGNRVSHHNNLYKDRSNGVRSTAGRPTQQPAGGRGNAGARPSQQPNNVYADKNGNVHRNQGGEWQQRDKNGWSKDSGAQARPSQNDLNKQYQARERSTQRTQNYNRAQSRPSGRSGGGGRRR